MPVRRIPMGRRSLTGAHNWDLRALGVSFESSLERDFVTLMLFEPSVTSIEEQPVRIHFRSNNKAHDYVPDFLVQFRDQPTRLVEVKYAEELGQKAAEFAPKFEAAANYADERGWRFEIWSDDEIRTPRLANAMFLLPFNRQEPEPGLAARLVRYFRTSEMPEIPADEAIKICWDDNNERLRGKYALWHLVARRHLIADFDQVLNDQSSLRLARDKTHA